MRVPMIAGNWKMNTTVGEAIELVSKMLRELDKIDKIDKMLRRLVVTPDMHRVHHSVEDDETNSNFGFNLSLWDRLFGTYREQPRAGQEGMTIGIHHFNDDKDVTWITGMMILHFKGKVTDYVINRRQWAEPKPEHTTKNDIVNDKEIDKEK